MVNDFIIVSHLKKRKIDIDKLVNNIRYKCILGDASGPGYCRLRYRFGLINRLAHASLLIRLNLSYPYRIALVKKILTHI
jgi:hypothetical protein